VDEVVELINLNRETLQPAMDSVYDAQRLDALVVRTWQLMRTVGVLLIQDVLRRRDEATVDWDRCPHCDTKLESRGRVPRGVLTLLGMVEWSRKLGRCPKGCKVGHVAPLDETLGLAPRQRTCLSIKSRACLLAVFVPYALAARILEFLIQVSVSEDAIRDWVQDAGGRAQKIEQEHAENAAAGSCEEEGRDPEIDQLPMILGADGVNAPFRVPKGEERPDGKRTIWKEIKVAVLARLGKREQKDGTQVTVLKQRRVVAVRGEVQGFEPRLWGEALRQGLRSAGNVVWLSDGGVWLWNLLGRLQARCSDLTIIAILDFYHASQNLWKGIEKCFEVDVEAAKQYFEDTRHQLRHGNPAQVLEGLKAALGAPDLTAEARTLLSNAYEYLLEHKDHIDYAIFKKLGIPIGSGFVESACKWLVQQRFKCVGMRWTEQGFDNLLYLRVAWVNGRFDPLFAGPGDGLPSAA
jgi:hypothetical protein